MKISTIAKRLERLGFSPQETALYLELLVHGPNRAGVLSTKLGLHRGIVYKYLEVLVSKKMIAMHERRGVKTFTAEDPAVVSDLFAEKHTAAISIAQELQKMQNIPQKEVRIYEGEDVIKNIAAQTLTAAPGSTVYFFGPSKFGIQADLEQFWNTYHKKRIAHGIHCAILYDQFTPEEIVRSRNKLTHCKARYLPINSEMPMSFILWDNLVAIIVPSDKPPTAFVIRSNDTHDALQTYFSFLWNAASPPPRT